MFKAFSVLKKYYRLVRVKPALIVFEFLSLLFPAMLSILTPVILADIISALTVFDYSKAILKLTFNFVIIAVSSISYFVYHLISSKVNKTIIFNIQNFLYQNVKSNENIKSVPASVFESINTCADFNKTFLYKACFFIKSIVLLSIISYFNVLIGFVLIAVSIISFFLLKFSDKKIQQHSKNYSRFQAESLSLFNNIQAGESTEKTYGLEQTLKDKYFKFVETNVKTKNKISLFFSINNNFISIILKATVFACSIFLVRLVENTTLTLTLYLILTPYLTSSAENLISFFELFSDVAIVETLLFDFEELSFTTEKKEYPKIELSTFNLYFFDVSAIGSNSKIKNLDLKIPYGSVNLFVGDKGCGKRTIFELLKRSCKPNKGTLFLDGKNIFDIEPNKYSKIISSTVSAPHLYDVSVFENLLMVCSNKTRVAGTLKSFGIKTELSFLPEKENSIITSNTHPNLAFFIGLARCYLSDAKIINVYEIPSSFSSKEFLMLKKITEQIKKHCTINFFTHTDDIKNFCNNVFYVESGEIKNQNKN